MSGLLLVLLLAGVGVFAFVAGMITGLERSKAVIGLTWALCLLGFADLAYVAVNGINWPKLQPGSASEWAGAAGSLAAVVVALLVSGRAQRTASQAIELERQAQAAQVTWHLERTNPLASGVPLAEFVEYGEFDPHGIPPEILATEEDLWTYIYLVVHVRGSSTISSLEVRFDSQPRSVRPYQGTMTKQFLTPGLHAFRVIVHFGGTALAGALVQEGLAANSYVEWIRFKDLYGQRWQVDQDGLLRRLSG